MLLTCRVPRERVLLSHYDDWHSVLNASLCCRDLPGEDVAAADARTDALQDDFHTRVDAAGLDHHHFDRWPTELRAELEATREIIFDPAWYGRAAQWQATVHALRTEDVVEAVRFTD